MASFISSSTTLPNYTPSLNPKFKQTSFSSFILSPNSNPRKNSHKELFSCYAAKQQQSEPVKKRQSSTTNKKPVKKNSKNGGSGSGFKKGFGVNEEEDDEMRYQPLPLPKPPAGFIVDDQGRVVAVSDRRIATIVCYFNIFIL
ncbi:uncharacterized protein LOC112503713 [Cynara cardunculus var. scolymus]|uniref:uncharacterized protein LOC112503713 n=1 Tax=Cynara cardunculus var. scolymus TaxID=59895 RepID=UPI000D629A2C|nr:uncharacterized protein LOC112503713 [Cynara cardunculus var. scolymus]